MTIWLKDQANMEKAQMYGFGNNKDKCKSIGHVRVPQYDHEESMMYYFCFNCGKQVHKWPVPKNLPPTIPVTDYALYQDQTDPYNNTTNSLRKHK